MGRLLMFVRASAEWRLKRRFHRYFVAPFSGQIARFQNHHSKGARAVQAAQRERLHAALRGAVGQGGGR